MSCDKPSNYIGVFGDRKDLEIDLYDPCCCDSAESLLCDEMVMSSPVLPWSHTTWRISVILSANRLIAR